jgi:hypothetical protein
VGLGHFRRSFSTGPILVGEVHQTAHTGVDGGDHRRGADGMDVDLHANLGCFVDHRLENLNFLRGRSRLGRERDLAGVLDTLGGHGADCGPRLFGSALQVDAFRWNDAGAVDHSRLDVIPQRKAAVTRSAARQDGRVPGLQQRLHLGFLVGTGIDVLVGIDETRQRASCPCASMTFRPCVSAAPAPADTILPARITIVPEGMTGPLPTTMRTFLIARSCAGSAMEPKVRPANTVRVRFIFIMVSNLKITSPARSADAAQKGPGAHQCDKVRFYNFGVPNGGWS